jgi:hypothetical protein
MSDKRIAANRANARRSAGPRTARGKRRSARNALRHGLSIPIGRDLEFAKPIAEFARRLVGDEASEGALDLARMVAEGHFEIVRVRRSRERMFDREVTVGVLPNLRALKVLASIDRYEQRAIGRRRMALRRLETLQKLPVFG